MNYPEEPTAFPAFYARNSPQQNVPKQNNPMLSWIITFLLIALIAGALGFTGVAGTSIAIAKTLFFIFLVIFLVLLVLGLTAARRVG